MGDVGRIGGVAATVKAVAGAGNEVAVFASFFRIVKDIEKGTNRPLYAHSLAWRVTDLDEKRYYHVSGVDPDAPKLGKEKVERGEGTSDPRLRRAMREVLDQGSSRLPFESACQR